MDGYAGKFCRMFWQGEKALWMTVPMEEAMQWDSVDQAVAWLRGGGCVVYPTETLYALGCLATESRACAMVARRKSRPEGKPFPLIVSGWEMVQKFFLLPEAARALARAFWPGPLTMVLACRQALAPETMDAQGRAAVRMTPHPVAAALCLGCNAPLVATSANMSGAPAPARPEEVDRAVLGEDIPLVTTRPWPAGGKPSTIVVVEHGTIRVLREGAVARAQLAAWGDVV